MINLKEKAKEVQAYFTPKVIGEVNDVYVKLARINGEEVPWHNHANEDELFYIVEGSLLFEIKDKPDFTMQEGDLFIVPKGVDHRVSSTEDCLIMLIENKSTKHTGDVISDVTKTIEQQLE